MRKDVSEEVSQQIDSLLVQRLVPEDILEILKEDGLEPLPSLRTIRQRFKGYHESQEAEAAELDSAWF